MMHSARLLAAGMTPAPKQLSVVNATKKPCPRDAEENDTRLWDRHSMKNEARRSRRSKFISRARCARVGFGFFVCGVTDAEVAITDTETEPEME